MPFFGSGEDGGSPEGRPGAGVLLRRPKRGHGGEAGALRGHRGGAAFGARGVFCVCVCVVLSVSCLGVFVPFILFGRCYVNIPM